MAGPWEKYQTQANPTGKPWEKYAKKDAPKADAQTADVGKVGPDGMTAADRIALAKAGKLKVSPDRAAQQAAIDARAEVDMRDPGAALSALYGATQGATFGFSDELVGGIGAGAGLAKDIVTGNWDGALDRVGERYAYGRDFTRGTLDDARAARPKLTTGAEIAGAVASPVNAALAPSMGANLGANMLKGAGSAAAGGALYGAGAGEGVGDRLWQAGIGAVGGALIGGAIPAIAEVGRAGINAVADAVRGRRIGADVGNAFGISPQAARVVSDIVGVDDPAAMRAALAKAGPDAMLADASPALGQTLDGAMRSPVPGARTAMSRIEGRAAQAYDDITSAIGKAKPVQETMDGIRTGSAAARSVAYDAAYAAPIDYATDAGSKLLDDITPRLPGKAISYANELMRLNGEKSGQIMASIADDGTVSFTRLPDVRQWDYIKQALNQLAESGEGAGALGGQTRMGAAYSNLAKSVRDAVSDLVPEYKTALGVASDAISERNAVKIGAEMLSPKTATYDALKAIKEATPAEIAAMKDGVRGQLDEVLGNVRAVPSDQNIDARQAIAAFKEMTSPNAQKKLEALFGSDWPAIRAQLDRAGAALGLRARTSANSATAGRLFADRALQEATEPSAIRSGKFGQAARDFVGGITGASPSAVGRMRDAAKGEIADLLTRQGGMPTQNLDTILGALLANPANPMAGRGIYGAIMRGGMSAAPVAANGIAALLTGR